MLHGTGHACAKTPAADPEAHERASLLLCGVQVFAWLQRCCHPEAAEKEANYRYLQELEAEEDEKAAKQKADDLAGKNTNPLSARSSRSSEGSPRKEPQEVTQE